MKRKNEAGNALVITVLALGVLLGMGGLAIDVGTLRYEKRLQQNAADAAAIAGSSNIAYGGVTAGAQSASATNGFTDGTNNVTVTVNNPPLAGPHTGNASCHFHRSPGRAWRHRDNVAAVTGSTHTHLQPGECTRPSGTSLEVLSNAC